MVPLIQNKQLTLRLDNNRRKSTSPGGVTPKRRKSTSPGGSNPENADRISAKIEVLDWNTGTVFAYTDEEVKDAEQTSETNP